MDPTVINDIYDVEDRSSSLPTPEEARNSMTFSMADGSTRNGNASANADFDASFSNHDSSQLPSVEEARMNASSTSHDSNSSGKKKKIFVMVLLAAVFVVATLTAVSVMAAKAGTTESDFKGLELTDLPVESDGDKGESVNVATPIPIHVTAAPQESPSAAPSVTTGLPTRTPSTGVPTSMGPTASRYNLIKSILTQQGVSAADSFEATGSPQQKALKWIADIDNKEVNPETDVETLIQRYILTVFYYDMGGPSWRSQLKFLSSADECSWFRTFAAYKQKKLGASCNAQGKVMALNFPANYLVGPLSMELSKLTDLERLDVFNNNRLTGGFPEFLKGMPNINFVGIHYCGLTGVLPSWLGDLTTLKSLVLSNNEFQGPLPDSMASLTQLENLYLDDNQFQGDIGVLGGMKNMRNLVLEDNQFVGSFTDDMVSNWVNLETLDASHNRLDSTIPPKLMMIPNLRVIDLHENRLSGSIPKYPIANTALEMLTLNNNFLKGEIPSILGLSTNLRHVDLTGNKLSSTIPASLGNLVKLQILYLAENEFSPAPIPSSFAELQSLKQLSLKNTARVGHIPSWFGNLSGLTMLDLDSNTLSGAIPTSLEGLSNLEYLLVNRNNLGGTIPSELSSLSKLSFFVADKNHLIGSAEAVCSLPNADSKDLFASTDCRGDSPEVTCSCCNLCCEDGDTACNDDVWLADSNPMWELNYERAVTVEFDADASRTYVIQFTGDIPP